MVDANYVEYGNDALRVVDSSNDLIGFFATNGFALGNILAVILILFIIGITLAFAWRGFKQFFPK